MIESFIAMNKQKIGCALDYRFFFKITNFEIRNTNLQKRGKQVSKLFLSPFISLNGVLKNIYIMELIFKLCYKRFLKTHLSIQYFLENVFI